MILARLDRIHKDLHDRDFGCDHRLCAAGAGAGADPLDCSEKNRGWVVVQNEKLVARKELKGKKQI
jgi:hypothetical protein